MADPTSLVFLTRVIPPRSLLTLNFSTFNISIPQRLQFIAINQNIFKTRSIIFILSQQLFLKLERNHDGVDKEEVQ